MSAKITIKIKERKKDTLVKIDIGRNFFSTEEERAYACFLREQIFTFIKEKCSGIHKQP